MHFLVFSVSLLIVSTTAAFTKNCDYVIDQQEEQKARNSCEELARKYIPGFVRLIFHDCNGGCNGCVDLSNPDNAGLSFYMDELEKSYQGDKIFEFMSRADFWALCSLMAVQEGHKLSRSGDPLPVFDMVYGRKDCKENEGPNQKSDNKFPAGHDALDKTLQFFADEFGFSTQETTALLGAHTLGEAKKENSGFENEWVDEEDHFDNMYYRDMLNTSKGWNQVDVGRDGNPRWQWVHQDGDKLMLNADMCLLIDIQPDGEGRVSTTYGETEESKAAFFTKLYAKDNAEWLRAFMGVFEKMINHVSYELKPAASAIDIVTCQAIEKAAVTKVANAVRGESERRSRIANPVADRERANRVRAIARDALQRRRPRDD